MADAGQRRAAGRPIVIVSNRGPVAFSIDERGALTSRRGAGGLVSGIGPLVAGTGATWIAAAISEGDRMAATRGVLDAEGFTVQTLALDPDDFRMAYDVVCNAVLWFAHHDLFDRARRPRFDLTWRAAWEAYRRVNHAFADAVIASAPDGAAVLIQDYHLTLLAERVRAARPDLRLVHFSHTPFAGPDGLRVLPDAAAVELLSGLAAHDACGFHTDRWAAAFTQSCEEFVGEVPHVFVSPLAPEPSDIGQMASDPRTIGELARLDEQVGDRRVIARVDRIELSKNLLRGFHAFDDLLARYPEWRERVVFCALCYPSREGLAEYLAYRQEVEGLVRQLNERWATPTWTPVLFDQTDNYPLSIAALRRYDVLLVNPIRDGLNLVAKEGPLVNERDGVVVLSTEAGVWAELGPAAIAVNPFDVAATADALADALSLPSEQRAAASVELRRLAAARTPADWLADQLTAAG
jgi:trehalose 6-phosphate synthase